MESAEKEFLKKFLDINQPIEEKPVRFSTVVLLLKGGRSLSGRDIKTGVYEMRELNEKTITDGMYHSFQFSGLISYLIFLEQLGSIFRPKGLTEKSERDIRGALKHFSNIDENKINAIASLRNSMVHRFGLATEKSPRLKPPRKFTLSTERNPEIVLMPATDWTGDFSDKTDNTSTTIFIHDLIDLAESVYKNIAKALSDDNLEMVLADGMMELKARYTTVYG